MADILYHCAIIFSRFYPDCEKLLLASSYLSVRPSVRITRLPLDGLKWNLILRIFRKSVQKIHVSLKSDKNNGYFTWRPTHVYYWFLLIMRNVSDKSCREHQNIRTHTSCSFFLKSCLLWDNVGKYCTAGQDTNDNTIRRMRIACWITMATATHDM